MAERPQNKNLRPGRKPGTKTKKIKLKEAVLAAGGDAAKADPMVYFKELMADPLADPSRRDYAASQLFPYLHSKKPTVNQLQGSDGNPLPPAVINVNFKDS